MRAWTESQSRVMQTAKRKKLTAAWLTVTKHKYLYVLLLPGLLWYFIFRYMPMYGVMIAFKDYNFSKGIWGSPWVGLKHFEFLFRNQDFYAIVRNTLVINLYELAFAFPVPIILALLLNEMKNLLFKRAIQTVVYFPHFLSWVVFGGIVIQLLSPNEGLVNNMLRSLGMEPIFFLSKSEFFRPIVVISSILKESGWGAIIYLAALSSIDTEQYEAATIDGANRWQKLVYITLPGIRNTILIMLILKIGYLLDVGFEQIYILYNPSVYDVGDVLSTYIYRVGLQSAQFSITAAIGLFQSVIGFFLIWSTNRLAKKFSEVSLW
ncbi:ABC transporter permease [Paenibacillus radicis (ex Xue et al. 2023)]|uniref:ABC transporter permease subunit n=1 Tax=Paenibacillus radicis (ex Xue et al. 2023) TaxID=2972489 RepID=A0ABT1YFY8_9BACL|nr:ABC transporter permease subunit [Paenibacillus radicis (ex Xue et al. 2023)]MCR8632111.1 ABC transporter permease subunit [Paenibacillus radicis (ex Xue et al. 2023)]